jgi:predicted transport protein
MSDIKLFQIGQNGVQPLIGSSVAVEKSLQTLIERHLEAFLGVRFVASEHSTGKVHGGRIDTLGIDENNFPVIVEYKRALNENVISQGLFYLDWLMDHRADFKLLVLEKYGKLVADVIDWKSPRLLCIAGDFTKYDEYAIQQMSRSIELIRYRRYGEELLLLELVNATSVQTTERVVGDDDARTPPVRREKTIAERIKSAPQDVQDRYSRLCDELRSLGDDVQEKELKYYVAFKRIKNFACVEVNPQIKKISVFVKVDPDTLVLEEGFIRDVRKTGHFGTGDLEISINSRR